jgi:hypothetical protein
VVTYPVNFGFPEVPLADESLATAGACEGGGVGGGVTDGVARGPTDGGGVVCDGGGVVCDGGGVVCDGGGVVCDGGGVVCDGGGVVCDGGGVDKDNDGDGDTESEEVGKVPPSAGEPKASTLGRVQFRGRRPAAARPPPTVSIWSSRRLPMFLGAISGCSIASPRSVLSVTTALPRIRARSPHRPSLVKTHETVTASPIGLVRFTNQPSDSECGQTVHETGSV